MFASFPMYDWPEFSEAFDQLWQVWSEALRHEGVEAPTRLTRESLHPNQPILALQACGADWVSDLADMAYIGTPCYDLPGCVGACYSSWIITRRGAEPDQLSCLNNARAAVNGYGSLSGWWSLQTCGLSPTSVQISGAHRLSARMVAQGQADFAAIDAICFAYLQKVEPETAEALCCYAQTAVLPAPPFLTNLPVFLPKLKASLCQALQDPAAHAALQNIGLVNIQQLEPQAYDPIAALKPSKTLKSSKNG